MCVRRVCVCVQDEKILNKQSYETFGRIKHRIKFSGRWQNPRREWKSMCTMHVYVYRDVSARNQQTIFLNALSNIYFSLNLASPSIVG